MKLPILWAKRTDHHAVFLPRPFRGYEPNLLYRRGVQCWKGRDREGLGRFEVKAVMLPLLTIAAFLSALLVKERWRQRQMMLTNRVTAAGESVPVRLAPFWRRLAAFTLDLFLLGAVGDAVWAAFADPLSRLGDYRRLIVLAFVMVYFGCFESRWGRGRSIGKRLLDLRVIRPDGTYLSPIEAGLRVAVVTAPAIFNGAHYESAITGGLIGVVVIGLPVSMLYLLALSNNERQVLLHDLAFGTLVVRQEDHDLQRPPQVAVPLWRGHIAVVSLVLLASFLLIPFITLYFASK